MNGTQLNIIGAAIAASVIMTASFAVAWKWQANAYGKAIAASEASRQADLTMIANAGAAQARSALAKQQDAEKALAKLDKIATEEKGKLNDENDALRRAVADGTRRLRIAGSCSAGSRNLSGTASAASLGDAETVELPAAVGQAILDIRAGIIADQAALRTAQAYIRDACQ